MRCGKAHLIEIRNFEDFSIDFSGNMTVLTGKNGTGKQISLSRFILLLWESLSAQAMMRN
ncbi:MAG: AAA family ATPase [Dialister invisus]